MPVVRDNIRQKYTFGHGKFIGDIIESYKCVGLFCRIDLSTNRASSPASETNVDGEGPATLGPTLRSGRTLLLDHYQASTPFQDDVDRETLADPEDEQGNTPNDRSLPDTMREKNREMRLIRDSPTYRNVSDDPNLLPTNATKARLTTHLKMIKEYSHDLDVSYKLTHLKGENPWKNVITAVRADSFRISTRPIFIK